MDQPAANGAASLDKLRTATTTPTVMIGGKAAQVVFAGLSPQFVGVNQINVGIPAHRRRGVLTDLARQRHHERRHHDRSEPIASSSFHQEFDAAAEEAD